MEIRQALLRFKQKREYLTREHPCFSGGILDSNALSAFLFVCLICGIIKTIFFIDVEHDSSVRGAVQNEHVSGIVCNYKIYTATLKAAMHCSHPNLKNARIIF